MQASSADLMDGELQLIWSEGPFSQCGMGRLTFGRMNTQVVAGVSQFAAKIIIFFFKFSIPALGHDHHVLIGFIRMTELAHGPFQTVYVVFRSLSDRSLRLPIVCSLALQLRRRQGGHASCARSGSSLLARATRILTGVGIRRCVAILCSVRVRWCRRAGSWIHRRPLVSRIEWLPRCRSESEHASHGNVLRRES